jgi:hypothetical protein
MVTALVLGALPAGAHELSGFTVTCTSVSATVADTGTPDFNDHPMVWNVRVGTGNFVVVPTTEQVGPGDNEVTVVTGDISALTAALAGETVTVEAFVSFPSGNLATVTATVTCGAPAVSPTTETPNVGNESVQVSPTEVNAPAAVAPAAVAVQPTFTG